MCVTFYWNNGNLLISQWRPVNPFEHLQFAASSCSHSPASAITPPGTRLFRKEKKMVTKCNVYTFSRQDKMTFSTDFTSTLSSYPKILIVYTIFKITKFNFTTKLYFQFNYGGCPTILYIYGSIISWTVLFMSKPDPNCCQRKKQSKMKFCILFNVEIAQRNAEQYINQ